MALGEEHILILDDDDIKKDASLDIDGSNNYKFLEKKEKKIHTRKIK